MEESNKIQELERGGESVGINNQGNQQQPYENKTNTIGSMNNLKVFSKTDLFNQFNTEISEQLHENDIVSQQDLLGRGDQQYVSISRINEFVQNAIYPYLERIQQLEEIQSQKDAQITALFYTVKKMDEMIKKIETEQAKAAPTTAAKTSATGRKSTAVTPSSMGGTGSSVRSTSTATRAIKDNSSSLTQSTIVSTTTSSGMTRKQSVPSLMDSRKSNLSKSALHESITSKPDSARNSKVNTPASRNRDKDTAIDQGKKIVKVEKSQIGKDAEQKINSSQLLNGQSENKIQSQNPVVVQDNKNQVEEQKQQQDDNNQNNNSNKILTQNYNTAPPLLLQDLNNDSHLIDHHGSDKSDRDDSQNKNVLNNSNLMNEDSMLI